jgi:hypothetical protein
MRQIALRIPDELHEAATTEAARQGWSLNTFATQALLDACRSRTRNEWLRHIAESHRTAGFAGLDREALAEISRFDDEAGPVG